MNEVAPKSNLPAQESNPELDKILKKLEEKKFDPLDRLIDIADDMNLSNDTDAQKVSLAATKEVQRIVEKARDAAKGKGGNLNVMIPIGFNPDGSMNFEIKESHSADNLNGNK